MHDDHRHEAAAPDGPREGHTSGPLPGQPTGPAASPEDQGKTAGQDADKGAVGEQDTSIPALDFTADGPKELTSNPRQRGLVLAVLSRVRTATAAQIAMVTTREQVGVGYVRRALRDLERLGFVSHGKSGRHNVYHLTTLGQRAVLESGDVPIRPNAATGEKAIAGGLAQHGIAVTETLVHWDAALLDWDVEVAHPIDKIRSVISDAVLYRPYAGAEVEFVEVDRWSMSMSRLVAKLYAYEAYSQATYKEGERGTIGTMKYLWRQRYPRSEQFPVVRLVLANGDQVALDRRAEALAHRIRGISIRVDYAPLPMLQELPYEKWTWRAIGQHEDQAAIRPAS
ncbi:replication-relaxation family protein [Streptomyces sp. NPDC013489]|uniref:replication-relaxation family protein n=1 Tax=Streptomyces sp. NPDC013489 TaxID=3155606 RepID=UPI0033FB385B